MNREILVVDIEDVENTRPLKRWFIGKENIDPRTEEHLDDTRLGLWLIGRWNVIDGWMKKLGSSLTKRKKGSN